MKFEINASYRDAAVKRVHITPDSLEGIFVARDRDFTEHIARAIGLVGLNDSQVRMVEAGMHELSDYLRNGGDSRTFEANDGFSLVAAVFNRRSSGASGVQELSWIDVRDFTEFEPAYPAI